MVTGTQNYTPAMLINEAQHFEFEMSKKMSDLSQRIDALESIVGLKTSSSGPAASSLDKRVDNLKRKVAEAEQAHSAKVPTTIQQAKTTTHLIYLCLLEIEKMVSDHNVIYCDQSKGVFFTNFTIRKEVPNFPPREDSKDALTLLSCAKQKTPLPLSITSLCSIFECLSSGTGTLEVFRNCSNSKDENYDIFDPVFGYYVKILLGDFGISLANNLALQESIIKHIDRHSQLLLIIRWNGRVIEISGLNFYTLNMMINHWNKQSRDIYSNLTSADVYLLTRPIKFKKDDVEEIFIPMERFIFQCTEPHLFKNMPLELASFIIPAMVRRFVENPRGITISELFGRLAMLSQKGFPLNFPELIASAVYLQSYYAMTYPGSPSPIDLNQIIPCVSLNQTLYQLSKLEIHVLIRQSKGSSSIPKVFFYTGET